MTTIKTLLSIYIANLEAYNNGYLVGEWLSLPATEEEIADTLERIGCGEDGAEHAIHDYESDCGIKVDEYDNIDELNELAQELADLDEDEQNKVFAYLESISSDINKAVENIDRCELYENCETLEDLARELVDEGCLGDIPDSIANYIDYDAIVRDLGFDGYYETSYGFYMLGNRPAYQARGC